MLHFAELVKGLWYHFKGREKRVGCDFLSNVVKSIRQNSLNESSIIQLLKKVLIE